MNENEFKNFKKKVENIPDEIFRYFIPKTMQGISKEGFETAQFIFWFIYDMEMRLKELVRDIMIKGREGEDKEEIKKFVEDVFEELTLMGKINLIEKNVKREEDATKFKKLFSVLKELNNIRNTIFHQKVKIEDITYKGEKISERATKNKMIIDLVAGFICIE